MTDRTLFSLPRKIVVIGGAMFIVTLLGVAVALFLVFRDAPREGATPGLAVASSAPETTSEVSAAAPISESASIEAVATIRPSTSPHQPLSRPPVEDVVIPKEPEPQYVPPPVRTEPIEDEVKCPSGAVSTGLTQVGIADEREWIVGTIMNVVGQGEFHNGTSAPVRISSTPNVQGLNKAGRPVAYPDLLDFDYSPSPGVPRPPSIELAPGMTLNYSFKFKDMSSTRMADVVAWYAELWQGNVQAVDVDAYIACGDPEVVANKTGPSIFNTYDPRLLGR